MDNFPQLRKLGKRVMLSGYGTIIVLWLILTGFVFYDYTLSTFETETTKGGTFVEAITEPLSFLPYRGDPEKNHFFQTLLFRGCKTINSEEIILSGNYNDLCQVITLSAKEYEIRVNSGFFRSDKTPMTIDDVFFTYQRIIKENRRQQSHLQAYHNILITGKNDTSFHIIFPDDVKNHDFFFSLPVLPAHILSRTEQGEIYVELFSRTPVNSTCVRLDTTANDTSSLVFDMSNCQDNNINYYQLKSFDSDIALKSYLKENKSKKFLSLIPGQDDISGYKLLPVSDNSFMTIFFNTQSSKLTPRIQRALGGFIHYHFWQTSHQGYLGQYTGIINTFQSTGSDVASYIQEKNPRLSYDRKGLEQAGLTALPDRLNIEGVNNKRAFFLEPQTGTSYSFSLVTDQEMPSIQGLSDKSKKALSIVTDTTKKIHTITLSIGPDQQLQEGVNTITIKGKDNKVIDIDIYYLGQTTENETNEQTNKLTLVYYKNPLSNYIITQLEKIFVQGNLTTMINIVGYDDISLYRDTLTTKNYDIALSPVRMNSTRDIATLISTTDTILNPSIFINPSLANTLIQYSSSPTKNAENQIRNMLGTQMPFFILGQHNYAYHIRDDIAFDYTGSLSLQSLRSEILHHITLVSHVNVRAGKLLERKSFVAYINSQKDHTLSTLDTTAKTVLTGESILSGN